MPTEVPHATGMESPAPIPVPVGVGSWVERRARTQPDRIALISGEREWTYRELAGRIRRLAHGLRSLGVRRGDRVGWLGPNHPAFIETLFGTATVGAILAPANHRVERSQIAQQLEDAAPTVVVVYGIPQELTFPDSVRAVLTVDGALDAHDAAIDLDALVADNADDSVDEDVGPDDVCLLPYTSGTTGPSKGVMLTHGNVTWNAINMLTFAELRNDDVTLAVAPFFRTGGTGVNVLPVLLMGGTVVVPEHLDAGEILRLAERHRATIGFANPDLLDRMAGSTAWQAADLSSLRFFITGGAPVPDRLIRVYLERGVTLLQGYGLSEAAPVVLLMDPAAALGKVGAAGRPPLFVDIRIARADGAEVEGGATGELLVRGPNVMAGYWNRPEATRAAVDADGWLHTGDAARMDQDGDVWIVDRVRDRFTAHGVLVYPGEVERVIFEHPAVDDAGVVGLESPEGGLAPFAFVVVKRGAAVTEAEIRELCAARLRPEAVPRAVTFVERLPRNAVGKLVRHELASMR
jgi:fatty-acyl-CoA synthase